MKHASLNRSYRLVRRADQRVVPVPESARGAGAGGASASSATSAALVMAALIAAGPAAAAPPPGATQLPTGGNLVAGQANWQNKGATLTVNQASQRAVIDWQTFNLGSQASLVFNQAAGRAGATLNRVLDNQPSQILGRIQAPGQVFISNPYGVIFGAGASVDVGGLVATTMSMGANDFMAGGSTWQRNGATSAVRNAGTLTAADGGYIALLAPEVRNEGTIVARAGSVVLAAGESIRLDFVGSGLASVQVSPAELATLVENRRAILAPGGLVVLSARSADALRSGVVNQAGVIDASSLVSRGGRVLLEGDDLTLAAGSRIDASGATGGGSVLVGGDWQGSGAMHQATTVAMAAGARIDASATQQGDGGKVVVWSDVSRADSSTAVQGAIISRGGALGGDGGRVETSGHRVETAGSSVDAGGPKGRGGQWLIDPTDIVIGASEAAGYSAALDGGTNVLVQTAATGSQAGDITVNSEITWGHNQPSKLTLSAARNININAPISVYSNQGLLALEYGQGALASGNTSRYDVNAPITLQYIPQSPTNFSTKLGSDGTTIAYTVLVNPSGVLNISNDLAGHYVLGTSLNMASTGGGSGFTPIGNSGAQFTGTFDGLGHDLSNLTINRPSTDFVGLFGNVGPAGKIANVGLSDANVTGRSQVGALAGHNEGSISNTYSSGSVQATQDVAGGLVGNAISGSIGYSYSSATVASNGNYAGGLAGNNGGAISYSYATGNSTGASYVGGLVGYHNSNSGSSLTNSYASGTAAGGNLTGYRDNGAIVTNSAGGVDTKAAATFAGWDLSTRWTLYEGQTTPLISSFLYPLTVTAPTSMTYSGSLAVDANSVVLSNPGLAGLIRGNAVYGGGAQASAGTYNSGVTVGGYYSDQHGVRISYAPIGTLTINPATLTVNGAAAANKVYDGTTNASVIGTLQGVLNGDNVSLIGAGRFADKNVGTAKAVTTNYTLGGSAAGNYIVTPSSGLAADITPAFLTVNGASAAGKVYDGTTTAVVTGGALSGVIGGDAVGLLGSAGSFADKNAGMAKPVLATHALSGADAGNYLTVPSVLAADITPALLSVAGGVAAGKVYDGTTTATVTGAALNGVIGSDAVNLLSAGANFADRNVGTAKTVTATYALQGTDAGNYTLASPAALAASITQLGSVAWVGGASGDWFSPANWAGGAVPTLNNVANVIISGGSVATLAGSSNANAPVLTSLTGAGGVQLSQATLTATGAVSLDSVSVGSGAELSAGSLGTRSLTQSGGRVSVAGNLTVDGLLAQTGGLVRVGGAASIRQTAGDLTVEHLVANGVSLTAAQGDLNITNVGSTGDVALTASGRVTEAQGGSLTVLGRATVVAGDNIALDQARNLVVGTVAAQGRGISLVQGLDDLVLGAVNATGQLSVTAASGNIRQADASAVSVVGTTTATATKGSIYFTANTNRFGGAVSAAASDIALTQGVGALTIGDLKATRNLALAAGGDVTQNGALTVVGNTSVDAGSHSVTLDRTTNDFGSAVSVRSGALTLVDGVSGLLLGQVQTSGTTVVRSLDGSILQGGGARFVTTASAPASFTAQQAGAYTGVSLNTDAATLINGEVFGIKSGSSVAAGMASALSLLVSPAVTGPTTDAKAARRIRPLAVREAVPGSSD